MRWNAWRWMDIFHTFGCYFMFAVKIPADNITSGEDDVQQRNVASGREKESSIIITMLCTCTCMSSYVELYHISTN